MRAYRLVPVLVLIIVGLTLLGACKDKTPRTPGTDTTTGGGTSGPNQGGTQGTSTQTGAITLTASDGVATAAVFVKGSGDGPLPACLLVHMLGKDKSTYSDFQAKLADVGVSSLAIDLRGHGESTQGGTLDFKSLTDEQWALAKNDLVAGLDNLRSRSDVNPAMIGIVGASIGANLALVVAADQLSQGAPNPPKCLVLLSPGRNYHGIEPIPRARDVRHVPVYIVSAKEDGQSFSTSQTLTNATKGELKEYEGKDHGTDLFTAHPELVGEIIQWIKNRVASVATPAGSSPTDISQPTSTEGDGSR